ncbi:hypothetical protein T492DRAFT_1098426 [Pavlovales sp. CCMP2436]|nr:hypothetical protein T492DRAFT_1098426 [Pavlovales sp. CCMP2436]
MALYRGEHAPLQGGGYPRRASHGHACDPARVGLGAHVERQERAPGDCGRGAVSRLPPRCL